jgi:hypothetical protein
LVCQNRQDYTVRFAGATVLLVASLPVLAACSESVPPTTAPPTTANSTGVPKHTMRDLCEPLVNFLDAEFDYPYVLQMKATRDLDAQLTGSGSCHAKKNDTEYKGFVQISPVREAPGPDVLRDRYSKVDGYSADMWISDDGRTASVVFVTSVDGWNGKLEINLGSEGSGIRDIDITDAQKDAAAEFIIGLTRTLRS